MFTTGRPQHGRQGLGGHGLGGQGLGGGNGGLGGQGLGGRIFQRIGPDELKFMSIFLFVFNVFLNFLDTVYTKVVFVLIWLKPQNLFVP